VEFFVSQPKLTKVELAAGIVKDESPLSAEGGWVDSSLIRFVQGKPEVNAGWIKMITDTVEGSPRAVHAWSDLSGLRHMAIGTDYAPYVLSEDADGTLSILQLTATVTKSATFETYASSKSVHVTLADHPFSVGDTFFPTASVSVGGRTISGECTVVSVMGPDDFRIEISSNATSGATATGDIQWDSMVVEETSGTRAGPGAGEFGHIAFKNSTSDGMLVTFPYAHGLKVGDTITLSGFSTFGTPSVDVNGDRVVSAVVDNLSFRFKGIAGGSQSTSSGVGSYTWSRAASQSSARAYSFDNFGELLLVAPKNRGLYVWQPGPYESVVTNGYFTSDSDWAKGTGWSISSGSATKTAGVAANLSQAATEMKPGYFYFLLINLERTAGSVKFQVNAGDPATLVDVGSPTWNTSGAKTLTFVCPADPSDIVIVADSSFAGSIYDISVAISPDQQSITTAPDKIDVMWVDPNSRVVNIAGTVEADGDYNSMVVRNSAQENFRVWVPDEDNIADEVVLSRGSRIVNAKVTRQQTLIWTDAALFSQQFIGSFASPYRYQLMGNGCGLIGRNAAAEVNGAAFWLSSNHQFYIFNGQAPLEMDKCRLRKDVVQHISEGYEDRIFAGINSTASEFWLMYPDSRDGTDECSRIAVMNYVDPAQPWWTHKLARTAWLPAGVFRYPIGFAPTGEIYFHENGTTADGGDISAFITSAWFDIEDGDTMMAVYSYWPDFNNQSGAVNVELSTRLHQNAASGQIATKTATTSTRKMDVRLMGRQARIKLSSTGETWRLGAQRLEVAKTGARR
jgi:hypothetical protein